MKKALVTGAAGDIGAAVVRKLSAEGYEVTGTDVEEAPGETHCVDWVQADLSSSRGRNQIAKTVGSQLDVLVNNAAVQFNKTLVGTSSSEWEMSIAVNLSAPFYLIRELRESLARSSGSIVNVGSVHSIVSSHSVFPYAVSKSALNGLTRSTAIELASAGVRCNCVLLGAVQTKMLAAGLERRPHPDGAEGNLRQLCDRTPLGFIATPDEIVGAISFLSDSSQSGYMTGQVLVLDGGASLKLYTE